MCAQILKIDGRRRRDPLAIVAPSDFRTTTYEIVDASIVATDPRLSIYCLDESNRRAIFVQTPNMTKRANGP